jgi:hypothetical protein
MAKNCLWLIALIPLLALQTGPASACKSAGFTSSGEPRCITTSDGKGQPYTDGRSWREKRAARHHAEQIRTANKIGGLLDWMTSMNGKKNRTGQPDRQ